ncbi:energy-coupling factor transport system substrate-specific component [Desulfonispora thiosulfatigenes DSM 11270]|uniref:Energy-coupling factor transport system substrate-specific component n=2 Tax=Desulfonispora thiosulfatigenes TaxID=83661 RepID=A0A1W1UPD2_DESTI|nr:energy-coupling factor transport system substrate-specific component [Desulfonispora thiosulfatigenes DSM 11270]
MTLGIVWTSNYYLLVAVALMVLSFIPLIRKFEAKKLEAKEIVIIAILAAIAAVSRIPFAALPSVQPTSFVIIMTGIVFGRETGFLVGIVSAFVSNIFLGQGPWTPWQMFAWGLMGFTAGYFQKKNWFNSSPKLLIFGFVWGFIFGWIMNLWFLVGFISPFSWKGLLTAYLASFYFDLAHGISNVFFLKVFAHKWEKMLQRIKRKYGLFIKN